MNKDYEKWLLKNLVYCEDVHSFVHRLHDYIVKEKPSCHRYTQFKANEIISEMLEEYKK